MAKWPEASADARPRIAAAVGLLVSVPYWAGGPVWDDHTLILQHLAARSWADVASLWWEPVGLGETGAAYYRPLSMMILATLGRIAIPLVHALAGVLHAASAGLVVELGGRTRGAFVGALIFASHPVVWEVLGWASALPDALAVCLGLALVRVAQHGRIGLAGGLAFLAMAAKETAIIWVLLAVVGGRSSRRSAGACVVGAAVLLMVRVSIGVYGVPPAGSLDLVEALRVMAHQLGTLLWTVPLSPLRDTHHLSAAITTLGIVVVGGLGVLAWRGDRWQRTLVLLVLAPVMLALPTVWAAHLAGDRYVYASLAALALVAARWELPRRLPALAIVGAGMLILTAHRFGAATWHSDMALFRQAVRAQPQSAYAHHFLGHAYGLSEDWKTAAAAFDRARSLRDAHPLSAQLALEAHVRASQWTRALELARSGPRDGLTAEWIAWWAWAELEGGDHAMAQRLLRTIQRPDGSFDGPDFVPELVKKVTARQ